MADLASGFCAFAEATVSSNAAAASASHAPLSTSLTAAAAGAGGTYTQLSPAWQEPSLQIVDVQVQPLPISAQEAAAHDDADDIVDAAAVASKRLLFYVLLSDGQSVAWAVAPPGSGIASLLYDKQVEPGCMVTLHDYSVVPATGNGRAVVVLLDVSCDPAKLSLIGDPVMAPRHLYKLSPSAVRRTTDHDAGSISRAGSVATTAGGRRSQSRAPDPGLMRDLPLSAVFEGGGGPNNAHDASAAWRATVRIVWRSRLRKVMPRGDAAASASQAALKTVFDCRVVDAHGNGAAVVVWSGGGGLSDGNSGGRARHDLMRPGATVLIGNATLRRPKDTAQAGSTPSAIDIGERSVVLLLDRRRSAASGGDTSGAPTQLSLTSRGAGGDAAATAAEQHADDVDEDDGALQQRLRFAPPRPLPTEIVNDLCPLAREYLDVSAALDADVGASISVIAAVLRVSPITAVQTRHGRVDRRQVVLAPAHTAASTSAALTTTTTVNLTLWGPHCAVDMAPRTVWCLRQLKVGMYSNSRVLSSKSSTELVPRSELLAVPHAAMVALGAHEAQAAAGGEVVGSFRHTPNPHGGGGDAVVYPTGAGGVNDAAPSSSHQQAPRPQPQPLGDPTDDGQRQLPLQVSLVAASAAALRRGLPTTGPVVLRIAHVAQPIYRIACTSCGGDPSPLPGVAFPSCRRQPACLAAAPIGVFDVRLGVSDGVAAARAHVLGVEAARLIGCEPHEFAAHCASDPGFAGRVCGDLLSMPLVMHLDVAPSPDRCDPSASPLYRASGVDLTDFAVMARVAATRVSEYTKW